MFAELKEKDLVFQRHVEELDQLELQLSKYSKQANAHPKEDQIAARIEELYQIIAQEEKEKTLMGNTTLWGITRHLTKLEYDVDDLIKKGIIDGWDIKMSVNSDDVTSAMMVLDDDASLANNMVDLTLKQQQNSDDRSRRRAPPPGATPNNSSRASTPISDDYKGSSHNGPPKRRDVTSGTAMRSLPPRSNRRNINPNDADDGDNDGENEDDELYCFCQQVSFGAMVACDNPNCKYEWFHYSCVGLSAQPDGVWYCPDCRKDRSNRKERRIR